MERSGLRLPDLQAMCLMRKTIYFSFGMKYVSISAGFPSRSRSNLYEGRLHVEFGEVGGFVSPEYSFIQFSNDTPLGSIIFTTRVDPTKIRRDITPLINDITKVYNVAHMFFEATQFSDIVLKQYLYRYM